MIGTTRLVHSSIVKGVFRCSLTPRRHSTRALGRFRQWRPFRMALLPLGTWTSTSATTLAPPQCRWSSAVATEEVQEIPTTVLRRQKVRNVAIIAHVDHGKTTLVDELLKASERSIKGKNAATKLDRLMDSGELEKERGITIKSKVTRMEYKTTDQENYILNIVDTPGHADFAGEVDRILSMVDGVVLVVDAAEGPMTQTKYVLSRAIALNLQPILVLNKCDRPDALQQLDSGVTETALEALLDSLGASDEVKNCSTLYASARGGWIVEEDPFQAMEVAAGEADQADHGMETLLDVIIRDIPEPSVQYYGPLTDTDTSQPGEFFAQDKFSLAATTVGHDQYLGRTCTGRITSGSIKSGDTVQLLRRDGSSTTEEPTKVNGVFVYSGIERKPYEDRAYAGDCVTLTGVPKSIAVGDTLTSAANPVTAPIETPPLAPPTLSMEFSPNDGGKCTASQLESRLLAETDNNVTLKVEKSQTSQAKMVVFARGELQLGILIEQMRREGLDFLISPPQILMYEDKETGKIMEPFEEVVIDVDAEYAGMIVDALTGDRKGHLIEMNETSADGKTRLKFEVSTRGLLGFANEIATNTRGSAVVNHFFLEDREHAGNLGNNLYKSKLVSSQKGRATGFALENLEQRGTLFIAPGDEVYSGMVIGEIAKSGPDMEVNPCKEKEKTNIRTHASDGILKLTPPKRMTFEEMVGYMAEDEMIEVTPDHIRLRKAILNNSARERASRDKHKKMKATKK